MTKDPPRTELLLPQGYLLKTDAADYTFEPLNSGRYAVIRTVAGVPDPPYALVYDSLEAAITVAAEWLRADNTPTGVIERLLRAAENHSESEDTTK